MRSASLHKRVQKADSNSIGHTECTGKEDSMTISERQTSANNQMGRRYENYERLLEQAKALVAKARCEEPSKAVA